MGFRGLGMGCRADPPAVGVEFPGFPAQALSREPKYQQLRSLQAEPAAERWPPPREAQVTLTVAVP